MPAAGSSPKRDAFNWPALNRKDLLSQTGGLTNCDGFDMKTSNMRLKNRMTSANLTTQDIEGRLHFSTS